MYKTCKAGLELVLTVSADVPPRGSWFRFHVKTAVLASSKSRMACPKLDSRYADHSCAQQLKP